MNELALFAGAGGGILGGHLLGWRTVCAVELDAYARSVLLARQRDGLLPRFPVWDDVRTFDGKPWRGRVQVVSGGFPCTDISSAGGRAGIEGEHSGLWADMARIIGEVAPEFAFVENASGLVVRGLDRVLCPRCNCKTVYQYDDEDAPDDRWQRCAACGVVFDLDDHTDEDEDDERPTDCRVETQAAGR